MNWVALSANVGSSATVYKGSLFGVFLVRLPRICLSGVRVGVRMVRGEGDWYSDWKADLTSDRNDTDFSWFSTK